MSHHKKAIKPSVPESQLYISHGDLSDIDNIGLDDFLPHRQRNSVPSLPLRTILYQPFTSQINLVLSNNSKNDLPPSATTKSPCPLQKNPNLLNDLARLGTYQYLTNFNLADLLDIRFAQTYLRLGSLVAMSVSKVMGDDVFAIDGHGTIHMRLNQSTYQTLGLSGRRSKFGPAGQHFVVEIDIRDPAMQSGKPNYERTRKCLSNFPSSVFGDLLGPKHEFNKGRRWDVVMSWVDEEGNLQEIQPATDAVVKTCSPEINQLEKVIPSIIKPDIPNYSVESLLELYERVGEAILPTDPTNGCPEGPEGERIAALTIEAMGFFHPIKLAELAQTLIKSHAMISLTAHTARFSPFSFLINRMTRYPRLKDPEHNVREKKKKKTKKGKGVMMGPERGGDAGPTSWTLMAFDGNRMLENNDQDHSSKQFTGDSVDTRLQDFTHKSSSSADSTLRNPKRTKIDHDHNPLSLDLKSSPSLSKNRPWLIFESVGHYDTHC